MRPMTQCKEPLQVKMDEAGYCVRCTLTLHDEIFLKIFLLREEVEEMEGRYEGMGELSGIGGA